MSNLPTDINTYERPDWIKTQLEEIDKDIAEHEVEWQLTPALAKVKLEERFALFAGLYGALFRNWIGQSKVSNKQFILALLREKHKVMTGTRSAEDVRREVKATVIQRQWNTNAPLLKDVLLKERAKMESQGISVPVIPRDVQEILNRVPDFVPSEVEAQPGDIVMGGPSPPEIVGKNEK